MWINENLIGVKVMVVDGFVWLDGVGFWIDVLK